MEPTEIIECTPETPCEVCDTCCPMPDLDDPQNIILPPAYEPEIE